MSILKDKLEARCRTCRFSIGYDSGKPQAGLWCELRKIEANRPCIAWERAPGTEGDDD